MHDRRWTMVAAMVLWAVAGLAGAAELRLLEGGVTEYQIVIPDNAPSGSLSNAWQQAAQLVQAAFNANGAAIPIVSEARKDPAKPGLYLGNTAFARANRVEGAFLPGWGYVQKAVGRDVIVTGRDQPALPGQAWERLGTVKGVADFLREYAGVRFLYPQVGSYEKVQLPATTNLLDSPAFEFLPTPVIAIPGELAVRKIPMLEFNTTHPPGSGFYNIANNRFPLVDTVFGCHTYWRAVPVEKYYDSHPEYFALIHGKRVRDGQYCVSNPGFQELLYQDMIGWLGKGFGTVDLGHPDGFQPCQCAECGKLFNTGTDWSEKLWILHRNLAERVLKAYPDRKVMLMAYMATETPPKTFKTFPRNVNIMLCGTNEDDLKPWRAYEVPGGFTAYIYNWCPNLGTRYTPMRTPRFVERQVKRFAGFGVKGVNRDAGGQLYGLEGPVYYVMGRMFDDPESLQAKDLAHEFCGAAFGKAAGPMLRFYDQLYHGIELYSEYLGTRAPAWAYRTISGVGRKHLNDPFQLLGFLYPPSLLAALDQELSQAERLADSDRLRTRLMLVRREFEYVRHLARVVHLYQGFQIQPGLAARDRLLDAIDARNAEIASYYDPKNRTRPGLGWVSSLFPFPGHDANHLRLAYDGYQEPFKNSCMNWDTRAMRNATLPGVQRITVKPVAEPVGIRAPQWDRAAPVELKAAADGETPSGATVVRMLYDVSNLYVRIECATPGGVSNSPAPGRDVSLERQESVDAMIAPMGNRERLYRFMGGLEAGTRYDAAAGFITDVMDPRHNQMDPTWNGDWAYETERKPAGGWVALMRIPHRTLGVPPPAAGSVWLGNFGRSHVPLRGELERSIWSRTAGTRGAMDRDALGELAFEAGTVHAQVCVAQRGQTPVYPFATWATAASNIQEAVDAAMDSPLVLVEEGVYALVRQIAITNGITLKALRGPERTVLSGPAPRVAGRCVWVNHPGATVEGFTIRRGCVAGNGGGVLLDAGTLRGCLVTGNAVTNGSGGGVYAVSAASLIENCGIVGNSILSLAGNGGGVYLKQGARMTRSRVIGNAILTAPHTAYGAGVFMEGAGEEGPLVTGCDISSNTLGQTSGGYGGGGVRMVGAGILRNSLLRDNQGPNGSAVSVGGFGASTAVENCTVVGNAIFFPYQGGSKEVHGRVLNTIGDQNAGFGLTASNGVFLHCCFPATNGLIGVGNIAGRPGFVDAAGGNFRLAEGSPCVDAGTQQPWMRADVDIEGRPRLRGAGVDLGCHER